MSKKEVSIRIDVLSFGSALAMAISYTTNKSIAWAILHGLCSWLFVLWAAITYQVVS